MSAPLRMYVVTRNPTDFPGLYVAREQVIDARGVTPTSWHVVGASLEEVRAQIPPGLFRIARDPSDDAVIVETWL